MFEALFETQHNPCCILDNDGLVLAWNTAMQQLTGVASDVAMGQVFGDVQSLQDQLLGEFAKKTANFQLEWGDHVYRVIWSEIPACGWSMLLEDQTQIIRQQRDLMQMVSHDLKAPLSSLRGYLDLVGALGELSDQQRYYLQRAQLSIQESTKLTDQLLNATWGKDNLELDLSAVDLVALVEYVVEQYGFWAEQQNITLQLSISKVPPVLVDETRIRQVVSNLIGNAIKYSPDGGEILVTVQQATESGFVEFAVEDHGMGIPTEHLPHIFDRFYRVPEHSDKKIKGTGLGLFFSQDIIKKHGQKLDVTSVKDEGSRFYFQLPIAE